MTAPTWLTAPPSRRRATIALAGSLAAVLLAGCTNGTGNGTRAGGDPPPTTLRVGTDDPEGRPASDQILEFARQVDEISEGSLRIEPVFRVNGEGKRDWDQRVARLVVDGELDMGMIPARAWDTEGVDTMRALHAPFHVTGTEHLKAVAADDQLAEDLLSGLPEIGVTGLTLLPEGLRHYFAFDTDEPTVAAFEGARIRSPRSETTWALFEALGGEPTDADVDSSMHGAESEFALAGSLPGPSVALGNLVFFPKVNSLVANAERFADLEPKDQRTLRGAALATRDWAQTQLPDDAELAVEFCQTGGRVVLAEESEIAAMRDAARPVTARLRADAKTADLMDRIGRLGTSDHESDPAACPGETAPEPASSSGRSATRTVPVGPL